MTKPSFAACARIKQAINNTSYLEGFLISSIQSGTGHPELFITLAILIIMIIITGITEL